MRNLLRTVVAACMLSPAAYAQEEAGNPPADQKVSIQQQIMEMIRSGDLEAAAKAVQAVDDEQTAMMLRQQMVSGFLRKGDYAGAYGLSAELAEDIFAKDLSEGGSAALASNLSMMSMLAPRVGKADEAMAMINKSLEKFAGDDGDEEAYMAVASVKVRLLQSTRQSDEANTLASELLEKTRAKHVAGDTASTRSLIEALTLASTAATNSEAAASLSKEALTLAEAMVTADPQDVNAISRYASLAINRVSSLARSDAKQAEEALTELRDKFAAISADSDAGAKILERYNQSLKSIEGTIEAERKLATLVGSEAPELDAEYWVNGNGMTAEDLKGKVVLLDFWAVWCGPCIATFPHLREWQEEFGEQGFQVVGVTRKYNYSWDEEAGRASRADGENSDAEESAMLEKFLAHHELKHPTIVTPQDSTMQQDYAVRGIPHAVLIDREGKIQMIKVGSGDANAKALHDKIVELLGN
ncbi:TlpA family protein disulfide reductase [Planctomycetaceae bacterium SH139]